MLGIFLCLNVMEKYDEKDKKNTKKTLSLYFTQIKLEKFKKILIFFAQLFH